MDWQQPLVYVIVAAAALYLWRQYAGKKRSGCGGCGTSGGCGSGSSVEKARPEPELIQLELKPRRDPPRPR